MDIFKGEHLSDMRI